MVLIYSRYCPRNEIWVCCASSDERIGTSVPGLRDDWCRLHLSVEFDRRTLDLFVDGWDSRQDPHVLTVWIHVY